MSDIKDDSILDQQDAALTTIDVETPNTFGCKLLRSLGLAQGSKTEVTGSLSNDKVKKGYKLQKNAVTIKRLLLHAHAVFHN